jgi:hypothetical protein
MCAERKSLARERDQCRNMAPEQEFIKVGLGQSAFCMLMMRSLSTLKSTGFVR